MNTIDKIKLLASEYGDGKCTNVSVTRSDYSLPERIGKYCAFAQLGIEKHDCQNELLNDIEHGRGNTEEEAIENLYLRCLKNINNESSILTSEIEKLKSHLSKMTTNLEHLNNLLKETK